MDMRIIKLIGFVSALAAPIALLATYMAFITDWGIYKDFPYMFAAYLVYAGIMSVVYWATGV